MKSVQRQQALVLVLTALVILGVLAGLIASSLYLANNFSSGPGFWVPYSGARGFLEQTEPYSGTIARQIQNEVLGRGSVEGEPIYAVDYPFYILILYLPLGLVRDAFIARVIWMVLLEISALALVWFGVRLIEWDANLFWFILLFLFGLTWYYGYAAIVDGGPAVLLGLIYAGVLLSLRSHADEFAGFLLALGSFQWEVVGPLALMIFMWVYVQRRSRVFIGFGMAMTILLAISFLVYPGWLLPFARAVSANLRTGGELTTSAVLSEWSLLWGSRIGFGLAISLVIVLVFEWRNANARPDFRRLYWTACLTLAATPLLSLPTDSGNFAPLILPVLVILPVTQERWSSGRWLVILLLALVFSLPWAIFLRGEAYFRDNIRAILFLFLPVFTVVGLYWVRWWVMRPPRTWLDRVAQLERR